MELHSFLILATILTVIFSLTYFMNVRHKRDSRKNLDKQEPRFGLAQNRTAPIYPETLEEVEEYDSDENVNLLLDDPLLAQKPITPPKRPAEDTIKKKSAVEEILYLTIVAKPEKSYVGYELLQALLSAGLRFGAMNIFHRYEDLNGNGKILFSLASASEPGTFEINKMGAYSGKGLMMFLRLSSNKDLMFAFECMLETAKQLIEDLDGDILDDERKILTADKIEIMKKKILEFEQNQRIGDLFDQ